MFGRDKKLAMPTRDEALPGRDEPLAVPDAHFVNGNPLKGPFPSNLREAVFGLGCFWGAEQLFWQAPGVLATAVGYAGGQTPNPTYRGDHTGHYEAVEITYDPDLVTYVELLEHFWINVDPFDAKGQFCDKGPSYLSAIFVATDAERVAAEATKRRVESRFPDMTVVTPVLPAAEFFPIRGAESYHQDFYKKSPIRYRTYRWGCGRDRRLAELWGDPKRI